MDGTNGTSVRKAYSSYSNTQVHRYIAPAKLVECKLITEMARAANLLVVTKQLESQNSVIDLRDITGVLHEARKKVLELPEAKKLPLNWPFKTANQFYSDTIDFLTGKHADNELSMQILQKGYEAEVSLRFSKS